MHRLTILWYFMGVPIDQRIEVQFANELKLYQELDGSDKDNAIVVSC